MPQVANFGDVFININVDGTSVGFVGFVVLCVAFRKCLKRLLQKLLKYGGACPDEHNQC